MRTTRRTGPEEWMPMALIAGRRSAADLDSNRSPGSVSRRPAATPRRMLAMTDGPTNATDAPSEQPRRHRSARRSCAPHRNPRIRDAHTWRARVDRAVSSCGAESARRAASRRQTSRPNCPAGRPPTAAGRSRRASRTPPDSPSRGRQPMSCTRTRRDDALQRSASANPLRASEAKAWTNSPTLHSPIIHASPPPRAPAQSAAKAWRDTDPATIR